MRRGLSLKEECEIKRKEAENMSRDKERDVWGSSPGNRTNSDDPKLLNARVFIGNLASDKTTRKELEDKFVPYGEVIGVTLFRGYAFIQFANELEARTAVERENGGLYKGQRMDVKMAAEGRNKENAGEGRGRGRGMGEMRGRGRGRGGGDRGGRFSPPPPKARRLDSEYDYEEPARRPPPRDDPYGDDPYRRLPPRDPYFDRMREDPYRRDRFPPPEPFREPFADPLAPPLEAPPIDCVIFILERQIEPYAESILRRMRTFGVFASILPLPDESSVKPAMEDVMRRGTPFAILLNDQNEAHQSCTVNILHGQPQEHRNMPLEDAMILIERSFEGFIQSQKDKAAKEAASQYQHLPPGVQIQYLLNLLADNHHLTSEELTKIITYLEDRKKKVIAHEGPSAVAQEQEKAIKHQQQELQAKILSILGPDASTPQAPQPTVAAPTYSQANSQSVQQAIDTLMQSGVTLPTAAAAPAPPPPPGPGPMPPRGPQPAHYDAYAGYQY